LGHPVSGRVSGAWVGAENGAEQWAGVKN